MYTSWYHDTVQDFSAVPFASPSIFALWSIFPSTMPTPTPSRSPGLTTSCMPFHVYRNHVKYIAACLESEQRGLQHRRGQCHLTDTFRMYADNKKQANFSPLLLLFFNSLQFAQWRSTPGRDWPTFPLGMPLKHTHTHTNMDKYIRFCHPIFVKLFLTPFCQLTWF